jgi:molecular chaperone DnaK
VTRNVPLGIDHGTSNSAVAYIENDKPAIIKHQGVDLVMPSAVYIDRFGTTFVGAPAVNAMMQTPAEDGNGFTGYKLRIGQDDRYDFKAARKVLTAPELGTIVISRLLERYRETRHEDPKACVITVPANFEHSAIEGTRLAARKAGLVYAPFIQEPIAAALAYGFNVSQRRAQWLVFDLGGGTLDVSLVIVRNGEMVVPAEGHAGDTRLGGRKFDRDLLAQVLRTLTKEHGYSLEGFNEAHPKYGIPWGKLMLAVEAAKIELSKRQHATVEIDGVLCEDDHGKPVTVEVSIARGDYEQIIAADIERAIHVCQMLLARNGLTSQLVERLILVGGPTKTPYLRRMLTERLGIAFDTTVDPMTVVAAGAALYGMTHEIPENVRAAIGVTAAPSTAAVQITLQCDRASNLPTHWVNGVIDGASDADRPLTVEISRSDGLWSSGSIPVDEHGMFSCNLALIERDRPHPSRFTTVVKSVSGRVLAQVEEPEVWHPFPDMKARLANSLRVALTGNHTERLVNSGVELPARGRGLFQTTKLVRRGSSDDVLRIPVLEAVTDLLGQEDDHADCNFHVGTLFIKGSDAGVTSDLPEGSEVDLTISQDESRTLSVVAYVPLLDETFEAGFTKEGFNVSVDRIAERFADLKQRLADCVRLESECPTREAASAIEIITRLGAVESIATEIEFARGGERDACYRAYINMLKLAGTLNKIWTMQTRARIEQRLAQLKAVVAGDEKQELDSVSTDWNAAASSAEPGDLANVERRVSDLDTRVRRRPLFALYIDLLAFPDKFRGTQEQLQAYQDGVALVQEIIQQSHGSLEPTPQQLQRAIEIRERLNRLWPELPEWRRKRAEEQARTGAPPPRQDLSDLTKAGMPT